MAITTKVYKRHLQHLLTHIIIKKLGVSRVVAKKRAAYLLNYVSPHFVSTTGVWDNHDIGKRLIVRDFNKGDVSGFFDSCDSCDMPTRALNLYNKLAWGL